MRLFRNGKSAGNGSAQPNSERLVYVSFNATSDAMACKEAFDSAGIEGRLVTVPREISAGCGYAWRSPLSMRAAIERELARAAFEHAGVWEL